MPVRLHCSMVGTAPLLMHNDRLADPLDPISKEIKTYTKKKRSKTEEDIETTGKLEWMGGLYVENGQVVVPSRNLMGCFVGGGKITREGRDIGRALKFETMNIPLIYEGPKDIKKLQDDPEFAYRRMVKVQASKTVRVRPRFFPWALEFDVIVDESILNPEDFVRIAERAGQSEGLGDSRITGFGRFTFEVIKQTHLVA